MLTSRLMIFVGSIALLCTGCTRTEFVDEQCSAMREIGLSSSKKSLIHDWIKRTLADPSAFASSDRDNGTLAAIVHDVGLDWAGIGMSSESGVVEMYGENLNYREFVADSVEAVIVGDGYGYKLIFKLKPNTRVEKRFKDNANKPYGGIRMESLAPDVTLVCQRRT